MSRNSESLCGWRTAAFGDHGPFGGGELVSRARSSSTRNSRTYIALNRAARNDRVPVRETAYDVPSFKAFARTDLTGLFYSLPLGWTLSEKTGDIVSVSSGRFWDCLAKDDFNQSREKQSNADCLQIKVFHLLNGSVTSAFQALKDFSIAEAYVNALDDEKKQEVKVEPDALPAMKADGYRSAAKPDIKRE